MTDQSAPSLTPKLRQIKSLLALAPRSALTLDLVVEIEGLRRDFPIQFAELCASPKQQQLQTAFFKRADETGRKCDIFCALGGNRSGKSWAMGWLCFAKYLRHHAVDGDWFWCVAQNLDRSVGGQQQEIWRALPRQMFGKQVWEPKNGFGGNRAVTLPTSDGGECLIEFRSADQEPATFEQAKLRGVWIDERIGENIYARLLPRITDRDGWILYSDLYEQFWQMQRLVEAPAEAGVYCQRFTMYDNAANLPAGIIDRRKAQMSSDEQAAKIMGELVMMEGLVYGRSYDEGRNVCQPFRGPIPDDWPRWRAIDYGASAPTACVWFTLSPAEVIYAYREYYQKGLSIANNAAAILAMSGDEQYQVTYMDPHAVDLPPVTYGVAKPIAQQYAEAGIPSTGWPFVQTMGEHAMVERVKLALEQSRFVVFDTCTNLRREFRSWTHDMDKDGKPKAKDAYSKENCHALDTVKGFIATNPVYCAPVCQVYTAE